MNPRARTLLQVVLFGYAFVQLAVLLSLQIESHGFQKALAKRLRSMHLIGQQDGYASATRDEAEKSGLIGRIEIPRVGLSAMVVEGTGVRRLQLGVGHVRSTAFPGERDNVALAGHRDTHFRKLRKVERGDLIRMRTPDGVFDYRIDSILIVRPDRADLVHATKRPMLTLVTCYPFHWIGPAPKRFVVRASLTARNESEELDRVGGGAPS